MGIAGGGSEFSEHTDLVYSFSLDEGKPKLDVAVILRSACPIRELGCIKPENLPPIRPPGAGCGGGSTSAGHSIFFDRDAKKLWLDAEYEIPLLGANVVLLDGVENPGKDIVIAGRAVLPDDFLQGLPIAGNAMTGHIHLTTFLSESLWQLPDVQEFCK